jgi:hypothetical protein
VRSFAVPVFFFFAGDMTDIVLQLLSDTYPVATT